MVFDRICGGFVDAADVVAAVIDYDDIVGGAADAPVLVVDNDGDGVQAPIFVINVVVMMLSVLDVSLDLF